MAKQKKSKPEEPVTEATEEVREDAALDTTGLEAALTETDDDTAVAAPAEDEQPESTEQDSGSSLREFLKAQGLEVGGESDEEAVAALRQRVELAGRYEQVEHERNQFRDSLAHYQATLNALQPQLNALQAWQAEQARAKQPEAPPVDAFFDKLLEEPKLPKDWQSWLDPTTKQLREETPAHVRQAVTEYIDYRDNLPQRMVAELKANLGSYIRAEATKLLESQIGPQIESVKAQQATNEFVRANADWLYEKDQNGRPLYDPVTLNGQTSAAGNLFSQFLQQAISDGITSRDKAISRAMRDLQSHVAIERSKIAQATNSGAESRRSFEREQATTRKASRGGSIARSDSAPNQNVHANYRDMLAASLKEAGYGE